MLILLAALLSCFNTPASVASASIHNATADYYPYLSERIDEFSDGTRDRFIEIHLPCNEQFTGLAGNGQLRPITRTTEFNLTGTHVPHRYKIYDLDADRTHLMTEIVEHRCSIEEFKDHLSLN